MGLFSKIGNALSSAAKAVVGKGGIIDKATRAIDKTVIQSGVGSALLGAAGTVAQVIPGVGTLIGGAALAGAAGLESLKRGDSGAIAQEAAYTTETYLGVDQVGSIVNAVQRDGVIKVDKIENTIASTNPTISVPELLQATQATTTVVNSLVPSTVNDSASLTNIGFFEKLKSFVVKYKYYVLGGVIAGLFFFKSSGKSGYKKKSKKSWL